MQYLHSWQENCDKIFYPRTGKIRDNLNEESAGLASPIGRLSYISYIFSRTIFKFINYSSHARIEHLNFFLQSDLSIEYFGHFRPSGEGILPSDLTKIDKIIFLQNLHDDSQREIDINEYFEVIFSALKRSISLKLSCDKFVMDVTSPNIGAYLNYFSDIKIIFMIRNPISCYNSYKRSYYKNVDFLLQAHFPEYMPKKFFDILYCSFLNLNQFKNDQRVLPIRLEDLQADPQNIMLSVADFLEICFDKSLLQPTELGVPCRGNLLSLIPDNENSQKIIKINFSDNYLTKNEKYLISNVIPCDPFYSLIENETDETRISFVRFLKLHKKWWKTKAKFPKNIVRILYGLLVYLISYRSYLIYIKHYFKKYHLTITDERQDSNHKR